MDIMQAFLIFLGSNTKRLNEKEENMNSAFQNITPLRLRTVLSIYLYIITG